MQTRNPTGLGCSLVLNKQVQMKMLNIYTLISVSVGPSLPNDRESTSWYFYHTRNISWRPHALLLTSGQLSTAIFAVNLICKVD